ncbi:hypothetical protein AURDEDRAFT_174863 [Auricularia subglabra TFB-10046 SS5]|nr:hypothetical protein AURDEDRAFT_174863 [Auricularia subglabra TFB-10046 SS5]
MTDSKVATRKQAVREHAAGAGPPAKSKKQPTKAKTASGKLAAAITSSASATTKAAPTKGTKRARASGGAGTQVPMAAQTAVTTSGQARAPVAQTLGPTLRPRRIVRAPPVFGEQASSEAFRAAAQLDDGDITGSDVGQLDSDDGGGRPRKRKRAQVKAKAGKR